MKKEEMKTVAIIGESFGATGKGLYVVRIAELLDEKINVKLFLRDTAPYNSRAVVKVKTFKTKIRLLAGLGYYIPLFFKLRKDKSIDLIHTQDEKAGVFASFLKKPVIITFCDALPFDFKFPFNYVFRILHAFLDRARAIVVISNSTGNLLTKKYPALSKKVVPIHLGVDINRFQPVIKNQKCVHIGILGNLDQDLVNIFERILREYGGEIKIILGGTGIPKKFEYLKQVHGITFGGFIKDSVLPKHYQNIDIFVYKTKVEGFGLIPLEAMASGCAVVSSNVDSLPEVIREGGLLVGNTEEEFYDAIKKLIENKNLRVYYQKKGRERTKELTWNKCAKKHLELYKKVLNGDN